MEDDLAFPGVVEFEGAHEQPEANSAKKKKKTGGFESMGLNGAVYRGVKKKGYRVPTPIQRKVIPLVLAGRDVVAMARTGSGKTAAFLVPMLNSLGEHSSKIGCRGVILSPTRELAMQTFQFCKEIGRFTDLRMCLLVGGKSMDNQFEALSRNPDIIVATPGRMVHHISEVAMPLKQVSVLVFDEADRMFEMGFEAQLRDIMKCIGPDRQTLLFSATMPEQLAGFARAGLQDAELVRLDAETKISTTLQMQFFTVRKEDKDGALLFLLRKLIDADSLTIVFAATRHHTEYLHLLLNECNIGNSVVYGSMDQTARQLAISRFRRFDKSAKGNPNPNSNAKSGQGQGRKGKGKKGAHGAGVGDASEHDSVRVLLVTDVAARGIDIPLLDVAINYDFPASSKLFVHRVGRVARNGRHGVAYSLVASDELPYMVDLHLFLGRHLKSGTDFASNPNHGDPDPNDVYYGSIPQELMAPEVDTARQIAQEKCEIVALQSTVSNAYRLYYKTRPASSPESVRRAKELVTEGLHPLLALRVSKEEVAKLSFIESLRTFRPSGKDVLRNAPKPSDPLLAGKAAATPEAQAPDASHKNNNNPSRGHEQQEDDDDDAEQHTEAKAAAAKPAATGRKKRKGAAKAPPVPVSFRDDAFFMETLPSAQTAKRGEAGFLGSDSTNARLEDMMLDLAPDEGEDLARKKSVMKWDARKKKYVQTVLRGNESILERIAREKNESGAVITNKKRKKSLYEEWKQKKRRHVQTGGEEEGDGEDDNDRPRVQGEGASKGKASQSELKSAKELRDKRKRNQQRKKSKSQLKAEKDKILQQRLARRTKLRSVPSRSKAISRR